MTVAAAAAPSMFAVFRRRDFSLLWLAQLVSTAGSGTDRPGGRHLRLAGDRIGPGGRPDPDGHGDPEPRRGPPRRRVRRPSRPASGSWSGRASSRRSSSGSSRSSSGSTSIALPGLYLLLLLNAGIKQFFDPAHDSLIPEIASDEELAAANSFLSIASFGSTAIGFAGAGLLAGTVGLQWAFIIDAGTFLFAAGCISADGPPPHAEARGRRECRASSWTT